MKRTAEAFPDAELRLAPRVSSVAVSAEPVHPPVCAGRLDGGRSPAGIGTTVTGALAAIGGRVATRRIALAHVLFNLATGIIALKSLPGFLRAIVRAQSPLGLEADVISLAAFLTANIAGAWSFLPFVHSDARSLERWLPETGRH